MKVNVYNHYFVYLLLLFNITMYNKDAGQNLCCFDIYLAIHINFKTTQKKQPSYFINHLGFRFFNKNLIKNKFNVQL